MEENRYKAGEKETRGSERGREKGVKGGRRKEIS